MKVDEISMEEKVVVKWAGAWMIVSAAACIGANMEGTTVGVLENWKERVRQLGRHTIFWKARTRPPTSTREMFELL
jgi:hypothetical protein